MDNLNHRLERSVTRNAALRLALGSLYLSMLFVLLSVSFVAPMVSEMTNSAAYDQEADPIAAPLSDESREQARQDS